MAIEPEWKAGIKSKAELSREYGVSRAAMDKHFGALGIKRDLGPKIRAKAERRLQAEQVTEWLQGRLQGQETDIVEVSAGSQAQIHIEFRPRRPEFPADDEALSGAGTGIPECGDRIPSPWRRHRGNYQGLTKTLTGSGRQKRGRCGP